MKIDFTKEEALTLLRVMKDENETVRLVDPVSQRVYDEALRQYQGDTPCCKLWGRCERCENCTSLSALQTRSRAYKLELYNQNTYWVASRFLRIDGTPYIMETVDDVTKSLMMDSNRRDEIGSLIQNYNHLLITDAMTGAYNRRFLDENFMPSLECCHERGLTVNLAVMDIDRFKQVNDVYGHRAGDQLLRDVAGFWRLHFDSRKKDRERLVVRYGGDEFLVITCGIRPEQFRREIERDYEQMRKICYYAPDTQIPFSLAFGLSTSDEFVGAWDWKELFDRADQEMYDRKKKTAEAVKENAPED